MAARAGDRDKYPAISDDGQNGEGARRNQSMRRTVMAAKDGAQGTFPVTGLIGCRRPGRGRPEFKAKDPGFEHQR